MLNLPAPWEQHAGFSDFEVNPEDQAGLILLSTSFRPNLAAPNLVKSGIGDIASVGNIAASVSTGQAGQYLGCGRLERSTNCYSLPNSALATAISATGEASCLVVLFSTGSDSSGNAGPLLIKGAAGGNADHYPYSDGLLYLGALSSTSARWISGVAPQTDLAKAHAFGVTFKNGAQAAYINGKEIATATNAHAAGWNSGASSYLGSGGCIFLFAIWNKAKPAARIRALTANPPSLIAEPYRNVYVMGAAGGYTHPTLSNARMDSLSSTTGVPLVDYAF